MHKIDGFQTTDSFRFDRTTSSSTISLSSSSGYGSRLSLSQTDPSSSANRRIKIKQYFKEKISRHKSLTSLFLSSSSPTTTTTEISHPDTNIYDHVWNLDEQIEKLRLNFNNNNNNKNDFDCQSILSMSVDTPKPIRHRIDDQDILSAAAWYQEGLPEYICEEYLNRNNQPIGSFLIRYNYKHLNQSFILSIKTNRLAIEHFLIQRTIKDDTYHIQGSSKVFVNLSTLVIHHTVIKENLPVRLVLPLIDSTLNIQQQPASLGGIIRSVRF